MNFNRLFRNFLLPFGAILLLTTTTEATTLDRHSGLEFTSGGVDYLGLEILEHEDGVGTIWLAIPKNHDLDVGPVDVKVVLAPDVVTPVEANFDLSDFEASTTLDRGHSGLEFTSGGVDYIGMEILEHEDGVGTIWLAIPKNHDLDVGPVDLKVVLAPDVVTPISAQLGDHPHTFEVLTSNRDSSFHDPEFEASTTLDRHSGLQFTSGGVDYIGLRILEHEDGVGTIWLAIPKNHDLDVGPVDIKLVLAPDVVTPVGLTLGGAPVKVDYGAFEAVAENYWQFVLLTSHSRKRGDLDSDGCVSSADFLVMNQYFGQSGDLSQGDLNHDGLVTIADFATFQQKFGTCLPGIDPMEEDEQGREIARTVSRWPFLPDTDLDGMPDAFEELRLSNSPAPLDFRITLAEMSEAGVVLEWKSVAGAEYVVERSETGRADSWVTADSEPIRAESQSTMRVVPVVPTQASTVLYRIRALGN